MVTGRLRPPTLNTLESVDVAALMVTLAPEAVSIPGALALSPTMTLPKFKVVGVTLSVPTAVTPDPDNGTDTVEALDVIVTFPLAVPAEAGLKPTVKLAL